MVTTRSAFVALFRQVRELVDREDLLVEVSTDRLGVLVDTVPDSTWTRLESMVLQVMRDEYVSRLMANAQRMTTIQILGVLPPIADMTECESQAVLSENVVYTEELTKRHPEAHAAVVKWFHSATSEQSEEGPAPAVVAAVLKVLNLR